MKVFIIVFKCGDVYGGGNKRARVMACISFPCEMGQSSQTQQHSQAQAEGFAVATGGNEVNHAHHDQQQCCQYQ